MATYLSVEYLHMDGLQCAAPAVIRKASQGTPGKGQRGIAWPCQDPKAALMSSPTWTGGDTRQLCGCHTRTSTRAGGPREETGVDIQLTGIVGVFTDPTHVIHYTSNDEVRQEFTVVYRGEPIGGQPMTSSESTRVEWVLVERLPDLPMDRSQRKRIDWALNESEPHIDPDTR